MTEPKSPPARAANARSAAAPPTPSIGRSARAAAPTWTSPAGWAGPMPSPTRARARTATRAATPRRAARRGPRQGRPRLDALMPDPSVQIDPSWRRPSSTPSWWPRSRRSSGRRARAPSRRVRSATPSASAGSAATCRAAATWCCWRSPAKTRWPAISSARWKTRPSSPASPTSAISAPTSPTSRKRFPAHLHINLAAAFRSQGIGAQLIEAFAGHAKRAGAPGMHAVTGKGMRNVRFYIRCGFTERATALERPPDRLPRPRALASRSNACRQSSFCS